MPCTAAATIRELPASAMLLLPAILAGSWFESTQAPQTFFNDFTA